MPSSLCRIRPANSIAVRPPAFTSLIRGRWRLPFRSTGTVLVISGCFQTSSLTTSPACIRYSLADATECGFSCARRASPHEMAHIRTVTPNQTRKVFASSMMTSTSSDTAIIHPRERKNPPLLCLSPDKSHNRTSENPIVAPHEPFRHVWSKAFCSGPASKRLSYTIRIAERTRIWPLIPRSLCQHEVCCISRTCSRHSSLACFFFAAAALSAYQDRATPPLRHTQTLSGARL